MAKEVANARRKQHLSSLQYYCALNALQYRKRVAMMEPMLGYTRGQVWTIKLQLGLSLGKVKHCSLDWSIYENWQMKTETNNPKLYSACLGSNLFTFVTSSSVFRYRREIPVGGERGTYCTLVCKICLGLILSQLSVQQHLLLLFGQCLHKLSYVAFPLLAHNAQHTDEECTPQGTEHALEN